MHVVRVVSRQKGREYTSVLLRNSYREDGKVKKQTLANLSHLPPATIDVIERSLRGEHLVSADGFEDPTQRGPRRGGGGTGHAARAGPREAHRPSALPAARPRDGDDRGAPAGTGLEARHEPDLGPVHARGGARGERCLGGRAVWGDGLAARAPGSHRGGSREATSRARRPRALRPHQYLRWREGTARWRGAATAGTASPVCSRSSTAS